jgi:hypothetical protein
MREKHREDPLTAYKNVRWKPKNEYAENESAAKHEKRGVSQPSKRKYNEI